MSASVLLTGFVLLIVGVAIIRHLAASHEEPQAQSQRSDEFKAVMKFLNALDKELDNEQQAIWLYNTGNQAKAVECGGLYISYLPEHGQFTLKKKANTAGFEVVIPLFGEECYRAVMKADELHDKAESLEYVRREENRAEARKKAARKVLENL